MPAATIPGPHVRRELWVRVLVIVGAIAAGLILQRFVLEHLATLETLAETDPIAARRRLAMEVRLGGFGLFGLTAALGGWLAAISARAFRTEQFPPPGVPRWCVGRSAVGPAARRMGIVGVVLGSVLLAASLAGGAVTWRMVAALLACRAS